MGGENVDITLATEHKIALLSALGYSPAQIGSQLHISPSEVKAYIDSDEGRALVRMYQNEFDNSDLMALRNNPDLLDAWVRNHLMALLDSIDGAVTFLNDTLKTYDDNPGLVLEGLRVYANLANVYRQVAHDIHTMIIDNLKLKLSEEKLKTSIEAKNIVIEPEEVDRAVQQALTEGEV